MIEGHLGFLIDDYGFSLTTRDYGREIYFDFERGLKTVSISLELGSEPIVEIFGPVSQFGGEIVPWAEKDGINRGRRFLKTRAMRDISDRDAYVQEIAERLIKDEREWLEH